MENRIIRGIPSDGTDVDHSVTELDEGAPSDHETGVLNLKNSAKVPIPRKPHRLIGISRSAM